MKNFLVLLLVIATISITCLSSYAGSGDAGCGIGSLIIQKNSKISQLVAATINTTTLTQAFGITSGTSNCSANGIVFRDKEATVFVEANLQNLKIDMARGQGESLSAFTQLMGCRSEDVSSFGMMTRKNYESLFPNSHVQPNELLQSIKNEIRNDSLLNAHCTTAS